MVGRKAIAMGVLRWPQKRRDLVRTPDVLPGLWLPARTRRCPQVGNNTCHATENSRIGLLAEFTYRLSKPAHAPNSLRQKPLKRSASSLARRRTYATTGGALRPPLPLLWPVGVRLLRRPQSWDSCSDERAHAAVADDRRPVPQALDEPVGCCHSVSPSLDILPGSSPGRAWHLALSRRLPRRRRAGSLSLSRCGAGRAAPGSGGESSSCTG